MKRATFSKIGVLSIIFAPLLIISNNTYASGSFSGGGQNINPEEQKQYHAGKSALRKKLKCSGCPLGDKKVNKSTAPDIINQLQSGAFSNTLVTEEEQAITAYLTRRYKIK